MYSAVAINWLSFAAIVEVRTLAYSIREAGQSSPLSNICNKDTRQVPYYDCRNIIAVDNRDNRCRPPVGAGVLDSRSTCYIYIYIWHTAVILIRYFPWHAYSGSTVHRQIVFLPTKWLNGKSACHEWDNALAPPRSIRWTHCRMCKRGCMLSGGAAIAIIIIIRCINRCR